MEKVDIKGGDMMFEQRIELGQIITNPDLSEFEKIKLTMLCLDPGWKISELDAGIEYYAEVLEGILYWVEREKTELKYNPTAEELAAGIETLSIRTGEMSTIMAIAKDFGQDPDVVLKTWKYGKVFNILFTNLQSYLYRERLEKRLTEKAKAEAARRKGKSR